MTTDASRGTAARLPLVERDRQVAAIAAALDDAIVGLGRLVVIEGEAGTGKTRLLEEAWSLASVRGIRTLRARGGELERDFPFGLMRQLLEAEAGAIETLPETGTSGEQALSMLRNLPPAEPPPLDALFAMVHGLYWVCARLCDQHPTAFLVDDLHWGDEPSVRALEYLGNRVQGLPGALVVSLRSATDAGGWIREEPSQTRIRVEALSKSASGKLLEQLLGSVHPRFATSAFEVSSGNPLLLREVALATATLGIEPNEDGAERISALAPASVAGWALERLDRGPRDDRHLVASLAVLEAPSLRLAAAHAELGEQRTREAADRLAALGILDEELPLRFAHPIVRRALYDEIPPAARDQAHHRAAQLLSEDGSAPEQIASHLLACEPRGCGWAVQALRAHAAVAAARGASAEAARSLQRAISERSGEAIGDLLLELGLVELAMNDPAAVDHLSVAIREADAPETRAAAQGGLAYAHYLTGDTLSAFEAASAALEAEHGGRASLEAALLVCSLIAGRAHPDLVAEVRARLAGGTPEGRLSPAGVVRCQVRALDQFLVGERGLAAESARRAADALLDPGTVESVPALLTPGPAFVLAGLGHYREAEPLVERALARAARRGSRLETGQALYDRIWMRWRIGDLQAGLADCELLFSLAEGAWELAKTPARVAAACMLIDRGDLDLAGEQLELPGDLETTQLAGTWGWSWVPYGRGLLALARGDAEAALALAEECGARLVALDARSPEYCAWRSLASRAALATDDAARARELAEEELRAAQAIGSKRAIGLSLAALGNALGGSERIETLREAVAVLGAAEARLGRAQALIDYGMALRRSRHPREAREPLREGADLAGALGATPLARLGLGELRAAGGRPRHARSTGVGALTPRERQVAELARAGLANPEIAQRLFITRKTVEAHLRSVFRKLGVSAREQLDDLV
jgi:DNA-binding CsgD family transcriptional regulator